VSPDGDGVTSRSSRTNSYLLPSSGGQDSRNVQCLPSLLCTMDLSISFHVACAWMRARGVDA
jgi:hypothetical protein